MIICEKDLFNYIYYFNEMSSEKLNFIRNNEHLFKKELSMLSFLHDMINHRDFEIDSEILEKLYNRIHFYKEIKEIYYL